MKRKYETLQVVKMYSTLTMEHWKSCLEKAAYSGNVEKLVAWRYGMQAGLSDAVKSGLSSPEIDLWVIKRCRDCEKAMKYILRKKYPNPLDVVSKTHKGERKDYVMDWHATKKKRDQEFEMFLRKSAF